jgi:hypothetical protein
MKLIASLTILCLALFTSGCKSTRATNQKTLAAIQYSADAAMKLWGGHVAREQRRLDSLPEADRVSGYALLLERRLKVDDARTKFSTAWAMAWRSANFKVDQPPTPQAISLLSDLERLVNQYAH